MEALLTKIKGIIHENVYSELPKVISQFRIDTPARLSHFLGQCAHESGGFKTTSENLNYRADRLLVVFPKYFNASNVGQYAGKPEKIASRVYGSRMGNGNEASGEGWKYRGRGYKQLTGKNNYAAFDAFVEDDILGNPDLVSTKYPLLSAAWFWHTNKLNAIADKGVSKESITEMTRKINGGVIGIDDRIKRTNAYFSVLK